MKRILIIGASGLLGTKFYEIAKDKYEVFGTYHFHELKGETFLN